jgi:hypothetical protein
MKTMIVGPFLTMLSVALTLQAEPLSVSVDKGVVLVTFVSEGEKPYSYSIIKGMGESCEVEVKETDSSLSFKHSKGFCHRGATIRLTIRADRDVNLKLDAGNLIVLKSSELLSKVSQIDALVSAGLFKSHVPSVKPARTSDYAGAELQMVTDNKTAPALNLKVKSGILELQK